MKYQIQVDDRFFCLTTAKYLNYFLIAEFNNQIMFGQLSISFFILSLVGGAGKCVFVFLTFRN